jgi:hypothetical protein
MLQPFGVIVVGHFAIVVGFEDQPTHVSDDDSDHRRERHQH